MTKNSLRNLYVHVGMVIALMSLVLVFSIIYVQLPPTSEPTGLVLIEYPDLGITEGLSEMSSAVKASPDKNLIMLSFYAMWIIIVGIAAVLVNEYRRR